MTNVDGFFLERAELRALDLQLRDMRELAVLLAIAIGGKS